MYDNFLTKNRLINRYQLAKLYTFESAARHLSFSLSAEELCISPSAVSHQIQKLEQELGFKLFKRFHRRIELTHDGKHLFDVVRKSLRNLNQEILEISNQEISGILTIYARPSFAQGWLVPKLPDFARHYPYITLNILSGNEVTNFSRHRIDLAIYYDALLYEELNYDFLMSETIIPVCSDFYAKKHNLYNNVERLSNCTILHDSQAWEYDSNCDEWMGWANHYSLPFDFNDIPKIDFDRSDLATTAAINHGGVAMGRRKLIGKLLESGELITPFPEMEMLCKQRYYILRAQAKYNPKADIFIKWLKSLV
ncbi:MULTISPECIES: DNA-binding transcriptional regulator DsdC [unclassified Gilliamella]|uniref:DNA-binding transcriptional regulator DsdC n=1 Tax=unclassified Gilliamella TaxID=2685620 RepID=UPI00226AF413|nr:MULTISPECIES: DNA-binding transcriptional regulator DsdC [unclassified Gilliamella]MCX8641152.1 DNA-binding transcriptional regulator DsdC [Gilliamella sp. B3835]MCX8707089.1 DNA-binding transcriptional regulator DsdC [Gilliamella sp. B3783]MCX8710414.1 DNA-binding transcriptional regulator DsdC [Gilliamella sp. B3780]MCX8715096.1 DNA-binding transcriptional regulator DsdC [Gilliamella sp. B3781]MCX8716072.1 DNA-binding transcriptional regulator DsdC [Gilliamella sp. B3784]